MPALSEHTLTENIFSNDASFSFLERKRIPKVRLFFFRTHLPPGHVWSPAEQDRRIRLRPRRSIGTVQMRAPRRFDEKLVYGVYVTQRASRLVI